MSRENVRTIGMLALFVAIVMAIIFREEIGTIISEAMMEQADSLVDQLLR